MFEFDKNQNKNKRPTNLNGHLSYRDSTLTPPLPSRKVYNFVNPSLVIIITQFVWSIWLGIEVIIFSEKITQFLPHTYLPLGNEIYNFLFPYPTVQQIPFLEDWID